MRQEALRVDHVAAPSAQMDASPELDIRKVAGSERVWLKIDQSVTWDAAIRIMQILQDKTNNS